MTGFGSLFVFVLGCLLFPCDGKVSPPLDAVDGTKFILFPGSTVKITWSFDDTITGDSHRSWTFEGSGELVHLAEIDVDDAYKRLSSSLEFDIQKPATLVLRNVNQSYNGTYKFALSPSAGCGEFEVFVFILAAPNVTLSCPKTTTLTKGENFTCECRGQDGNPPANVTWYKDGVQISKTGHEEKTLSIINFGEYDQGKYTCKAQSHVNATDEKSIELSMYYHKPTTIMPSSTTPSSSTAEGPATKTNSATIMPSSTTPISSTANVPGYRGGNNELSVGLIVGSVALSIAVICLVIFGICRKRIVIKKKA